MDEALATLTEEFETALEEASEDTGYHPEEIWFDIAQSVLWSSEEPEAVKKEWARTQGVTWPAG